MTRTAIEGKTVVITGAASGIGRALALALPATRACDRPNRTPLP